MKINKLGNKGFAITGILYTLFILFILILVSVLSGLSSRRNMYQKNLQALENSYIGDNSQTLTNIQFFNENKIAPVTGKYIFQLNTAVNLINFSEITSTSIKGKINLQEGITYAFFGDISNPITGPTEGNWGNVTLELKSDTSTIIAASTEELSNFKTSMAQNKRWIFTSPKTGTYDFSLTKANDGYIFENIKIVDSTTCISYLKKGDSITDITFIPGLCNRYEYTLIDKDTPISSSPGITLSLEEIYSFESE